MRLTKAKWKRAPRDQRRVAPARTAPQARFTRQQRSGSLPPALPSRSAARSARPLLIFAGALALMVGLSVTLVIAVGAYLRSQQQLEDMQWRAAYYGRPTQPFSTLAPQVEQQAAATSALMLTTPLPGFQNAALAAPDDPRWVRGSAVPLNGSFDLRALPTSSDNNPLQTIRQTVACSFITDVTWSPWAQIKIGSTTAWVDTSTVRLEPAS